MMRWGYPCENITLQASTNHTLRLGSATAERIAQKVEENLRDCWRILTWNAEQGIHLFRVGQHLVPLASHQEVNYDWQSAHSSQIRQIGEFARQHNMRLSMHPGQYVNIGSPKPDVVEHSLAELRYTAQLLNLFGLEDSVLVVHLGGVYEGHAPTARRIIAHLRGERDILKWLALEHDERLWSLRQVLPVASQLNVPVIVDNLHHRIHPDGLTLQEAIREALPTWRGKRPKIHLSSQDPSKRAGAHALLIDPEDIIQLLQCLSSEDVDVMVEAKGKEQAVLPLLSSHNATAVASRPANVLQSLR